MTGNELAPPQALGLGGQNVILAKLPQNGRAKQPDNHTGRADGNSKTGQEEAGQWLRAAGAQGAQRLGGQPDHKIG